MKILVGSIWALLLCLFVWGQDAGSLIKEAERLEALPNEKAAFDKFKQALVLAPANAYILCKCSELCSRIGNREKTTSVRDNYYTAAVYYAKQALANAPQSDEANVVMAIAIGRTALTKSGKEKVALVKDIKHYTDFAIKYNKQNFKAWHVLGKWHYEVSNLNFVERTAVKMFYGGLPEASFKKAIEYYEKARTLKPGFMLNYLELARAYEKNDNTTKAVELLRQLLTLPNTTEDDPRVKEEAKKLLRKWE